jgi:hypothetical protein
LFSSGEQGVWFDPSDLTTMFVDRAGTTPVTTPGQLVGYRADKSGRGNHAIAPNDPARGTYGINPITGTRNLLTYTEQFDNAAWTKTRSSISANVASAPDGTTTADKIVEDTSNNSHFIAQSVSVAANASMAISIYAKPSGRDFLAIATQDQAGTFRTSFFNLSNGTLGTIAAGHTASIQSAGSGWYRCTVVQSQSATSGTFTFYPSPAAVNGSTTYLGNGTSGILIWGAQLEQSATATAYQRVTTQYDVTEVGVPSVHYVQYDGSTSSFSTTTITPGIDKVQVFIGARKFGTTGILVELSSGASTGSFVAYSEAPAGWGFNSQGSIQRAAQVVTGFLSPITNVFTGMGDISGDRITLRLNGTQVAQSTGDQGTGNYLAYPLFIGRRNNISVPFNGRDYGIIARFGANLTDGQITSTESWVNSKTGAMTWILTQGTWYDDGQWYDTATWTDGV